MKKANWRTIMNIKNTFLYKNHYYVCVNNTYTLSLFAGRGCARQSIKLLTVVLISTERRLKGTYTF